MILRNISKLAKNAINKSPIISKVFLEKVLKLGLHHWVLGFKIIFILMVALNHHSAKKQSGKNDMVKPVSPSYFEIIFKLLAKVVAI